MKKSSNTASRRERAERLPAMDNDNGPILPDRMGDNAPGHIYFANEARFVESNFSEPLTAYATGWRDPNNIEATLEFVAPVVPTSRRFEFGQAVNAEEFLSETDDIRAVGGSFKRVEFTSAKVNAKTLNKGLTMRVDMDNVEGMPNWDQIYTGRLIRRLWRNELRRAITLLSAAATNTAFTWDTTAGKDPDQDIQVRIEAGADIAGVYHNRALYGSTAWIKRRSSIRAQTSAGGFGNADFTPDDLAQYLSLDGVMVSRERYQSAAATKSQIVNNLVLLYIAEPNQTPEDPSNIKRFRSPTVGGTPVRVYQQPINAKLVDITVEHYSLVVITSTLGIQKATIS